MTSPATPNVGRWAVVLSSCIVAAPLALATFFGWILKAINPSDVDVSADLAYLAPILIVGWVLVAACIIGALVANVVASRSGDAKTAWTVFAVHLGLLVIFAVGTFGTNSLA